MDIDKVTSYRNELKKTIKKYKIDLEQQYSSLKMWEIKYNCVYFDTKVDKYSDIACRLLGMKASYIAPAYYFNQYIDACLTDLFWDDIKFDIPEEEYISMGMRECNMINNMQSCLIAIKMGLDRLLSILCYYYKGFSSECTFGHINLETGKAKGFMSIVCQKKDLDDFMRYIYDQYNVWIYKCVQPRDALIHYGDLQTSWSFDGEACIEKPIHICNKKGIEIEITFDSIKNYVKEYYDFFDTVFKKLFNMKFI